MCLGIDRFRSRTRNGIRVLAVMLALTSAASNVRAQLTPDNEIEQFLDDRGLDALLVEQLQERLTRTDAKDRASILDRLASLYVTLIESSTDPAEQAEWESRARAMLVSTPDAISYELRLNLERARYARAERTLERLRIGQIDPDTGAEALGTLAEIAPIFRAIAESSHQDELAIEQQAESKGRLDPRTLARALQDARRRRSLAHYLSGWSNVYLAEMTGVAARGHDALIEFGWLLGADIDKPPTVNQASETSLRYEHVARSAVGVAVAYATLGDGANALAWIDFVENGPDTFQSVRTQLPMRRLTILARLNRWAEFKTIVTNLQRGKSGVVTPLDTETARLIAILTLDPRKNTETALRQDMARLALADLVQNQELAQVADLAKRYGPSMLTDSGFISAHVRGLLAYESAREAHRKISSDLDTPVGDSAVSRAYRDAAEFFRIAVTSPDAMKFPDARAATAMLEGLSLFQASANDSRLLLRAIDAFQQATSLATTPAKAADAMWMAHRAARRLPGESDAENGRAVAIGKTFIERFPADERSSVLRVRIAAEGGLPPADAVTALLDTPRESPAFEASRRYAARLLYDLYRNAPPDDRDWSALRYADIAEPLLTLDRTRAQDGDATAAELAMIRVRRLLDALLSVRSPDGSRAHAALDTLDMLTATGLATAPPAPEIAFRRLQLALTENNGAAASLHADAIHDLARTSSKNTEYVVFADRALMDHATAQWRRLIESNDATPEREAAARTVIARGAQLLSDLTDRARTEDQSRILTIHAAIAHAAYDLWRITGDTPTLDLAYRRHRLFLEAKPNERGALRRFADLAEASGEHAEALAAWRTLSSGLDPNSDAWIESRVRLIELLSESDPQRAAEALAQHIALHPEPAPAPWQERLETLIRKLGPAPLEPTTAPKDSERTTSENRP